MFDYLILYIEGTVQLLLFRLVLKICFICILLSISPIARFLIKYLFTLLKEMTYIVLVGLPKSDF